MLRFSLSHSHCKGPLPSRHSVSNPRPYLRGLIRFALITAELVRHKTQHCPGIGSVSIHLKMHIHDRIADVR